MRANRTWLKISRTIYLLTPRCIIHNRTWLVPLFLGSIAVAVSLPLSTWIKVLALVLFVVGSLLTAALDHAWKDRQSQARQDIAGALGFIAERVDRRQNNKSELPKPIFNADLKNHQMRLLDLARRAIAEESGVPAESIWANWCLECEESAEGRSFRVEFFHGDAHKRTPGSRHPISDTLPGAAKAFSTTQVALVEDTHHPSVAEHFDQSRAYRCILSVPVRIADDGKEWVIGVANFDSAVPKSFSLGMHQVVADFVYLVGLCEGLKRWV